MSAFNILALKQRTYQYIEKGHTEYVNGQIRTLNIQTVYEEKRVVHDCFLAIADYDPNIDADDHLYMKIVYDKTDKKFLYEEGVWSFNWCLCPSSNPKDFFIFDEETGEIEPNEKGILALDFETQ